MNEHVLLTGGTGFVGSRLLRKWLRDSEARVSVLVRPRGDEDARARAERLLGKLGLREIGTAADGRLDVLAGDLTAPRLGLDDGIRKGLAETLTGVIHAGATVRFNLPLEDAWAVNTAGTASLLALARDCRQLDRFVHVSTAFVAGCREGRIGEDELDAGQNHHNSYERSKFEAERLVRAAMQDLPVTVLRPTIISCDLQTGEVPSGSAIYRVLEGYARGNLSALLGNPAVLLDLVPVDFVVDASFAIAARADSVGHGYHLSAAPDGLITLAEMCDLASRTFAREALTVVAPDDLAGGSPRGLDGDSEFSFYAPYLSGHRRFDTANSRRVLAEAGIRVPAVASYFEVMGRFISRSF
jgi:thioester reductase-like protein